MKNSIKCITLKEAKSQLMRAEVQKQILIKNIYKEYEIYFQIVRKSIFINAKKGILGLYSDLQLSDKAINLMKLNDFINKNIGLLIHSKLPLITIEQLRLSDIKNYSKQFIHLKALKDLVKLGKFETFDSDNDSDLITNETLEFYCNNGSNTYEYYESISEDKLSSVNLDNRDNSNSFPKQKGNAEFELNKDIDYLFKLISEKKGKSFESKSKEDKVADVFISINNLDFFEIIDKSFSHLLLDISYKINSKLFELELIQEMLTEDAFKSLSGNNYFIKHPRPFVIQYDLSTNKASLDSRGPSDLYLFNVSIVELEFYNLDLSICRNRINEFKNKFRLLNKKYRYWKNKELNLKNLN